MFRYLKNFLIIFFVFLLVGCSNASVKQKEQTVKDNDSEKVVEPIEEKKSVSVDLGLYYVKGGISF